MFFSRESRSPEKTTIGREVIRLPHHRTTEGAAGFIPPIRVLANASRAFFALESTVDDLTLYTQHVQVLDFAVPEQLSKRQFKSPSSVTKIIGLSWSVPPPPLHEMKRVRPLDRLRPVDLGPSSRHLLVYLGARYIILTHRKKPGQSRPTDALNFHSHR